MSVLENRYRTGLQAWDNQEKSAGAAGSKDSHARKRGAQATVGLKSGGGITLDNIDKRRCAV